MGNSFNNAVVVITGASSGIGRELALQLASQGTRLVLAARNEAALNEVSEACRTMGAETLIVQTDVSDKNQCKALIDKAIDAFGEIDVLINNAGVTMWARLDEVDDLSIAETIMSVNYYGSLYCTYYALPYLKKRQGRLVGISSLTGKVGVPTRSFYAASKHAMAGFFDSLRIELADTGVSVTMIYPGFVATSARERALGPDGAPLGDSPVDETSVMDVQSCCRQILKAADARKREVVMTFKGKLGMWLKLLVPSTVDRLARNAIDSKN